MQYLKNLSTGSLSSTFSNIQKQIIRFTSNSQPSEYISTNLENGTGRYLCQLQRITFKFCKEHPSSQGIREYIENDLVDFARKNPGIVVYLQPKRHRNPKIFAEYLNGSNHSLDVHQTPKDTISKWIEFLRTRKGGVLVRLLKKQKTHNPSIQGIWNPFMNKKPTLAVEKYPSKAFEKPVIQPETASDKILKLFKEQNSQKN